MSKHTPKKRQTVRNIQQKKGQEPIVVLTAYSAPMAALLDPHVDMLLVGDSLGMVLYGMDSTLGVSVDLMIAHAKAVVSASESAFVIVDMPFGSYQLSPEQAFENAARIMKETGCAAVKLEGGVEMAETVRFLTERGIPVMAHTGLKPQHVHTTGGYRYQGKTDEEKAALLEDAMAGQEAGAFAMLLECVENDVAAELTRKLTIPTIGIGAGAGCDGQVLVTEDMLGLFERTPKFVKTYGNMKEMIEQAVVDYAQDVRDGVFPEGKQTLKVVS